MAVAVVEHTETAQLGLYRTPHIGGAAPATGLCAGCQQREARYGFRGRRGAGRPGTLCFQCFRSELGRRQDVAERKRRGWNAVQAGLPLAETIAALHTRRRRAQIAARHALEGTTPAPLTRQRAS